MIDYFQLKGVEQIYGHIKALDSIDLDFEQGQINTLVGVNGSGKTTLLKILAGLEEPIKGSIFFNQNKIQAQELRQISTMVFQKAVMFNTSVYNNISFGLKIRG